MKKKQHNLLYKCINLDAPFISFQSHSAALKKWTWWLQTIQCI